MSQRTLRFRLLLTCLLLPLLLCSAAGATPPTAAKPAESPAAEVSFIDREAPAPALLTATHGIAYLRIFGLTGASGDSIHVTVVGLDADRQPVLFGHLDGDGLSLTDMAGEAVVFEDAPAPSAEDLAARDAARLDFLDEPGAQWLTKENDGQPAVCLAEVYAVFASCGPIGAEIIGDLINGHFSLAAWVGALVKALARGLPCLNALNDYNNCLKNQGHPSVGITDGISYHYGCPDFEQEYYSGDLSDPSDDRCLGCRRICRSLRSGDNWYPSWVYCCDESACPPSRSYWRASGASTGSWYGGSCESWGVQYP